VRPRAAALALALGALACSDARCSPRDGAEQAPPDASEASSAQRSGAAIASRNEAAPSGSPTPLAATPDLLAPPQPEAKVPLEPRLPDVETRIGAVLDADPSGDGLDFLMRTAREDPDAAVREAAVIALGDSEDTRAIDALVAAAEDVDARVVRAAIDELSWWSDDDRQARAALERLTRHPDAELATAAEEALGE
jgi:HEAT repeat protein